MTTALRLFFGVALVVALASAVTTTYVVSETAKIAAQTERPPQHTESAPPPAGCASPEGGCQNSSWDQGKCQCVPFQQSGDGQNNQGFDPQHGGQQGPDWEKQHFDQVKNEIIKLEKQWKKRKKQIEKEWKGTPLPQEVVDKIAALEKSIATINAATSADAIADIDTKELWDAQREIDEALNEGRMGREEAEREKQELKRREQDLKRMQKDMRRGATQGVKMFGKQIAQLKKQNVPVPAEISNTYDKLLVTLDAVQKAKTWEAAEEAGLEDIQDLFMSLEEQRQQLEQLVRWPQTQGQLKREIKKLDVELKRMQSLVKRFAKTVDLSVQYGEFESAVNSLKDAAKRADAQMNAGDAEGAFSTLEEEVFGQMEEVWQHTEIIRTMSNLSRFSNESQGAIKQAQQMVRQLKRQKLDTSELEEVIREATEKRNEIVEMIKDKDVDPEDIMAAIQEMEGIRESFEEKAAELTGEEREDTRMPWEEGPDQFKKVNMPGQWEKMLPQRSHKGGPGDFRGQGDDRGNMNRGTSPQGGNFRDGEGDMNRPQDGYQDGGNEGGGYEGGGGYRGGGGAPMTVPR